MQVTFGNMGLHPESGTFLLWINQMCTEKRTCSMSSACTLYTAPGKREKFNLNFGLQLVEALIPSFPTETYRELVPLPSSFTLLLYAITEWIGLDFEICWWESGAPCAIRVQGEFEWREIFRTNGQESLWKRDGFAMMRRMPKWRNRVWWI